LKQIVQGQTKTPLPTGRAIRSAMLAIEAQAVIGMRLSQIALGRGSSDETTLMVTEKLGAMAEAASTILTGGSAHMIADYRERVQANAQRLRSE
jgi:hypothetical protein